MLVKEIKEDLNKWRDMPCPRIGGLNIGRMLLVSILIYRLNAFLSKSQQDTCNLILNFIEKGKRHRI